MKENSKKLTVFVIIAALAVFMAVAPAWADGQKYRKTLQGEYAFTGSGACTIAPGGFNENFIPNNPQLAWMSPNFWEGVYTFYRDGTGKMETQQSYNEGPNAPVPYSSGAALLSWEFEYEICGGEITFTFVTESYYLEWIEGPNKGVALPPPNGVVFKPWTGRISPDGKNLFVFYGGPFNFEIPAFGSELICNTVHQGFRTK